MDVTCAWAELEFYVQSRDDDLPNVAGLYIFCSERNTALSYLWVPLYIGRASSLTCRVSSNHEKWHEALDRGFSHVHVFPERLEVRRIMYEKQLIEVYQPILNIHHR